MPADFDEPVFDEDFVRGASFTEPSAQERARPPSRRARRGAARRRNRAARPPRGRGFRRPGNRMAVAQLAGGILVLLAISVALWWWNQPSGEMEAPARVEIMTPAEPVPPEPADPDGGPAQPAPSEMAPPRV
ncbi:hypothetical protein [Actinomadura sp. WMMB 499]|uniref:hypothetical protein n=1 Tax=Actinomadura sp. WMMB 499 TaxID=1219491 RepID=UPI00124587D9|nr:hypothetical protein [Actinomadura sp. WMMB 499]QFG25155.1 hypothetical protein F7P10_32470 [Actinomadura sp. WMMB 499]